MKEIWKPINWVKNIPGDKYLISNLGNVYNLYNDTYVKQRFENGRKLFYVWCYNEHSNRMRNRRLDVATMVAIAFLPFPDGYDINSADQLWVNHKDMCVDNNTASNLEWVFKINKLTGVSVTVEAMYMIYELLLKYYNNRTMRELIDIIHNETGVHLTEMMLYTMCTKTHSEKSIIAKAFGLVGTSIQKEALRKDLMLRPIVSAALKGEFKKYPDERWVWLSYPNVKKEYYIISNYGRIYNKFDKEMTVNVNRAKHSIVALQLDDTIPGYQKTKRSHAFTISRLVAWHFCDFPKGIEEHELNNVIIKYKDANPLNIKYDNLYWTTPQGGTRHGIEIDKVKDIIEYVKSLVDRGFELDEITLLANHKFGLHHTSTKYRLMITRSKKTCYNPTYEILDVDQCVMRKRSPKNRGKMKLTDDEVRLICEMLVRYNGNSNQVYRELEKEAIPDITYSIIRDIRRGTSHQTISREFFEPDDFRHSTARVITVTDLNGEFIKRYESTMEMSEDVLLIPTMPSYDYLKYKFKTNGGRITIGEYVFQQSNYFTLDRKGCNRTKTAANVILEVDKHDNIIHVYFGRKDAAKTFGVHYQTISRWIKEGRILKNGNHLITMGTKVIPVEK